MQGGMGGGYPCFPAPSCMPGGYGPGLGVEAGGRVYYTTNFAKIVVDQGRDLDVVRELNLSPNTVLWEIYAGVRFPPRFAFTYNFLIPREDNGHGILPINLRIGNTTFAAGTAVTLKSTTSRHRWEGEYFAFLGPQYRAGPYLMGELLVETLRVETSTVNDQELISEFLMGAGASAEFAPTPNIFLKGKAAYCFLQNQGGVYLDGEARLFPDLDNFGPSAMGRSSLRPYVGVGYFYRSYNWYKGSLTTTISFQGPYASLGIVF